MLISKDYLIKTTQLKSKKKMNESICSHCQKALKVDEAGCR